MKCSMKASGLIVGNMMKDFTLLDEHPFKVQLNSR